MTFRLWLIEKKSRSRGPVGDLARDVAGDEDAPGVGDTHEAWRAHLRNAPENVLAVLAVAWKAYEAAVKREAASGGKPTLTPLSMQDYETPEAFAGAARRSSDALKHPHNSVALRAGIVGARRSRRVLRPDAHGAL